MGAIYHILYPVDKQFMSNYVEWVKKMFKNRAPDGKANIVGKNITRLRMALPGKVSMRQLADKMQLEGLIMDKNAIQKIECGDRFVIDVELKAFAKVFGVTTDELLTCKDEKDPAS